MVPGLGSRSKVTTKVEYDLSGKITPRSLQVPPREVRTVCNTSSSSHRVEINHNMAQYDTRHVEVAQSRTYMIV